MLITLIGFFAFNNLAAAQGDFMKPISEEKKEELRGQFMQGLQFMQQGKYVDALSFFKSNLREDPNAKGSLLMSAVAYVELGQFEEAVENIDPFLKLEPRNSEGLIAGIKSHQGKGNHDEAERLIARLRTLKNEGKDSRLNVMASFERELIPLSGGRKISSQEYFDYTVGKLDPVWRFLLKDSPTNISRKLDFTPAPAEEASILRQQNPDLKGVYVLSESIYADGKLSNVKIHRFLSAPDYKTVRRYVTEILE